MAENRAGRILFLAQTPPPHHGQSAIAARMRAVFEADAGRIVDKRWRGGAQSNEDVGRRSLSKLLAFLALLLDLSRLWLSGRRYEIAYLGLAPWAHTALRDALLAFVAKRLATRTWVHVHGDGLEDLVTATGLRGSLARLGLSGTELITITDGVARSARRLGLFSRVLPLANMALDPGAPEVSRGLPLKVAFLGNLDARKGVLDFVDCVAELGANRLDVEAVIIGGPTAQLSVEDVQTRAAERGLPASRLTVTGWVSETRKTTLLADADVFLYLSQHDLAPVALIEAMAHGCAPIVLDIGGLAEMVGPKLRDTVLPVGDRNAIRAAATSRIRGYLDHPDQLVWDKARARERYLATFSPDIFRASVLGHLAVDNRLAAAPATVSHLAGLSP
ncbi:MAG: glycosyltransferase [Pseudomonadota bacterium]